MYYQWYPYHTLENTVPIFPFSFTHQAMYVSTLCISVTKFTNDLVISKFLKTFISYVTDYRI